MADRQTQLLEEILVGQKALTEKVENLEQDVKFLKQGQETLEQGQTVLRDDVKNLDLKVELVNKRVGDAEQNLRADIRAAQEDTIGALKDLILPPLDSHEERITTLEEEVGIKSRKH